MESIYFITKGDGVMKKDQNQLTWLMVSLIAFKINCL